MTKGSSMSQQAAVQPFDGAGGVDLGLPVRAFNRSDVPVTWTYDRQKYVIPPKGQAYVPYMCMVLWQGDPRAIDIPGGRKHEQHRRQQREQLRVLYGVYEHEERWAEIPLVECYPIDSDVPFNTVLRDPDGTSLTETTEGLSQLRMMQEQMERTANQLRILQAQVASQQQVDAATEAANFDPEDLERQETNTRVASPEEVSGQPMVGPSPARRASGAAKAAGPKQKQAVTRDGE